MTTQAASASNSPAVVGSARNSATSTHLASAASSPATSVPPVTVQA
jgi:hypothetical protein